MVEKGVLGRGGGGERAAARGARVAMGAVPRAWGPGSGRAGLRQTRPSELPSGSPEFGSERKAGGLSGWRGACPSGLQRSRPRGGGAVGVGREFGEEGSGGPAPGARRRQRKWVARRHGEDIEEGVRVKKKDQVKKKKKKKHFKLIWQYLHSWTSAVFPRGDLS